jgi:hypothetical protein
MSDSNDAGAGSPAGPSRQALATAVVMLALLAAFVGWIRPPRADFTPAPLQPLPEECPKIQRAFVPSNITDPPVPALALLDEPRRLRAQYRLNFEPCPCGCNQSIAECLVNHPQCKVCPALAAAVVEKVKTEAAK